MLRKLGKSRRAMVFNITVVIITIIVLTYGFIRLGAKMNVDKEIGENPSEIILKVQEGEKALIFLDLATKLALYQAFYELQSQGGLTSNSACGSYYGFNMWNSDSGASCHVDVKTLQESLKKLFESNLVARVASYPKADFMMNTPQASQFARQANDLSSLGSQAGVSGYCKGSSDYQKDFTYSHSSGYYPPNGARVFVPAQANCAGSRPLIIYLHGCMKSPTPHKRFGDGDTYDLIPLIKGLYSKSKVAPAVFAAPSQTKGEGWGSSSGGVCIEEGALWGPTFDFNKFISQVKQNLPKGISVSSVSFVGHAGAGCSYVTGLQRAVKSVDKVFAVGEFDTCSNKALASVLKSHISLSTKFLALYAEQADSWKEQNSVFNINKKISCPSGSTVAGGSLRDCVSDDEGKYFAYHMQNPDHKKAAALGMEQFLLRFFPSSAAGIPSSAPGAAAPSKLSSGDPYGCVEGHKVAAWGDSSLKFQGSDWISLLEGSCTASDFENLGIAGALSSASRQDMKSSVIDKKFDQVIIMSGLDSLLKGRSTAEVIEDLQAMYSQAKGAGLRVVALTLTPIKNGASGWDEEKQKALDQVNSFIMSQASGVDVRIDAWKAINAGQSGKEPDPAYVQSDGIHLNSAGSKVLADLVFMSAYQKPGTLLAEKEEGESSGAASESATA